MLVTPIGRKFGKHQPGDVFELRDKTANLLIKVGKLAEARSQTYQTRDMQPNAVTLAAIADSYSGETESADSVVEDDAEDEEVVYVSVSDIVSDQDEAPWGRKADGTPRKRPGRAPSTE